MVYAQNAHNSVIKVTVNVIVHQIIILFQVVILAQYQHVLILIVIGIIKYQDVFVRHLWSGCMEVVRIREIVVGLMKCLMGFNVSVFMGIRRLVMYVRK